MATSMVTPNLSVCQMERPQPSYGVKRCGGRNLIRCPPLFTSDDSSLFVVSGQSILIYNVHTAEYVKCLKNEENDSHIVGMGIPYENIRSLITCDESGNVVTWKWHASVKSSERKLLIPDKCHVRSFHLLFENRAIVSWSDSKQIYVATFDLNTGEIEFKPLLPHIQTSLDWCITVGCYFRLFLGACSNGENKVFVFNIAEKSKFQRILLPKLRITTLAWSPSSEILAVGDSLGRVLVYYKPFSSKQKVKTIYHWHHLPVRAVIFSIEGGMLYTGGAERVIVAWNPLSNGSKRFIPRLPASIVHMSTSQSHIAVSTADNGIQIVETTSFRVVGCIKEAGGLGGVHSRGENNGPSLQFVRSFPGLLLPASSGHLHLFSTISNKLFYTIDITNTNIVHPERENPNPEQIEINEISVGCRSQWLATWEGKDEQERIRWWEWSGHDWRLHTVAACSHQFASFSAFNVAADTPVTLTADKQCNMRFWRILDTVPGFEDKSAWYTSAKCCGSGGEPGGAVLSNDGSVAAAWFGARLTFWNTEEGTQKASLAHPALRPQGKLVQFGRDNHMHYVICTTETCLAVWNIMTLRLMWIVKLDVTCLIADPFSDRLAAITKNNDVFIFKANDSTSAIKMKSVLPPNQGRITSAAFAPSDLGQIDFKLYFLRNQQEIFIIERSDVGTEKETKLETIGNVYQPISAFSTKIAKKQTNLVSSYQSAYRSQPSTKAALNDLLLSSAAHAQPRLSSICGKVLWTFANLKLKTEMESVPEPEPVITLNDTEETSVSPEKKSNFNLKKIMKEPVDWVSELISDD